MSGSSFPTPPHSCSATEVCAHERKTPRNHRNSKDKISTLYIRNWWVTEKKNSIIDSYQRLWVKGFCQQQSSRAAPNKKDSLYITLFLSANVPLQQTSMPEEPAHLPCMWPDHQALFKKKIQKNTGVARCLLVGMHLLTAPLRTKKITTLPREGEKRQTVSGSSHGHTHNAFNWVSFYLFWKYCTASLKGRHVKCPLPF